MPSASLLSPQFSSAHGIQDGLVDSQNSCFSNLVEELGSGARRTFLLRSDVRFTSELLVPWSFGAVNLTPTAVKPAAVEALTL